MINETLTLLNQDPTVQNLPKDSRFILNLMVNAADLQHPGRSFEFRRDEALAAKIDASTKTARRRVDDIVEAGLIDKRPGTTRIKFTEKMLEILHIKIEPETLAAQDKMEPAVIDVIPEPPLTLSPEDIAGMTQQRISNLRVVVENGIPKIVGEIEPWKKVNLSVPKSLHKRLRAYCNDHDLTLVQAIVSILDRTLPE